MVICQIPISHWFPNNQVYIRTDKTWQFHGTSPYSCMEYFYTRLDLKYENIPLNNMFKQYSWFSQMSF